MKKYSAHSAHSAHRHSSIPPTPADSLANRLKRYLAASALILTMVILSQVLNLQEIIFPTIATLAIGLIVLDKGVWRTKPPLVIISLSLCAVIGILIQKYSPLPIYANVSIAFLISTIFLLLSGAILPPLLSASIFPIFFSIDSWVFPLTVFVGSCSICIIQKMLETKCLKKPLLYPSRVLNLKKRCIHWFILWVSFSAIAFAAEKTSHLYAILPPLVVIFVEFSTAHSGFIKRSFKTWFTVVLATALGCLLQYGLFYQLDCPQWVVCIVLLIGLLAIFEIGKKYFAPAAAMALIPMLIPKTDLLTMLIESAIGAALFISISAIFSATFSALHEFYGSAKEEPEF